MGTAEDELVKRSIYLSPHCSASLVSSECPQPETHSRCKCGTSINNLIIDTDLGLISPAVVVEVQVEVFVPLRP